MIVSNLIGGIGNQLFMIAASIGSGEWYGNDWMVQGNFKHKDYFSIPEEKYVDRYALPTYTEPFFHHAIIPNGNWELKGYFQSPKYFKTNENAIRKYFAAPPKIQEKIKWKYRETLAKNTCAIHVRRNDYLKLSEHHYNLETEYYLNAIGQMKAMVPDVHFVCFSDDPKWCKENIPAQEFIKDEDVIEFHLMSYCNHFIIANSTFSWWGSWLSGNEDKLIIAPNPKKWFGIKKQHLYVHDLYCDNWIVQKETVAQ